MERIVRLGVPAEVSFARTVRMTAANLAVVCDMDVNEVEDVRMAAEEGFIYACATAPETCEVSFALAEDELRIDFSLGEADTDDLNGDGVADFDSDMVELLLSSVCDDFGISDDGMTLSLIKKAGAHDA